jgi:hypothetical protein
MDCFIFRDIVPLDVPIDKKRERRINTLSVVGAAILQAQKDLLEENRILNLEQEEMLKIVESGGEVNRVALDTNHKLGVLQKEEMDFLEKFLRLEIDFTCGTGTIGLNEEDIEIKEGFQITIPIDPKEKVLQFPAPAQS